MQGKREIVISGGRWNNRYVPRVRNKMSEGSGSTSSSATNSVSASINSQKTAISASATASVSSSSAATTATASSSFNQIGDERVFLGDKNAACDTELLARLKITHILTAELIPLPHVVTSHFPHMAVLHVAIADLSESDLLGELEPCVKFIRTGLKYGGGSAGGGGSVLVHCYHGVSRSAAIVAAYLMRAHKLSLDSALGRVRAHRPCASPNDGFLAQLRLFERMKCRVDPTDKAFKCYRLECIQNQILRTKILPAEIRVFKDQGFDPNADVQPFMTSERRNRASANKIRTSGPLFRCRKCRMVLASHASVLPHRSGASTPDWRELLESRQQKVDDQEMEKECKNGIFVEPMRWMTRAFATVADRIHCARCNAKLGSFSWNGAVKCGCGGQMTPGFVMSLSRLDKCPMLKEVEANI